MNLTGTDPAEEAFRSQPEFLDGELHPFSFLRQTAAVALGMRYGSLTEEDVRRNENPEFARREKAAAELAKKGTRPARKKQLAELVEKLKDEPAEVITWDGMTRDAAIVLWLCSQPDSLCQRARRKPREYEDAVDEWAEKNGLGMTGANLPRAMAEFSKILNAINESRGTPQHDGKPEEPDPNG